MNTRDRVPLAISLDVFFVVLFVAIGRRNHDEGTSLRDVFETGAPFLIGLGVAWWLARAWRRPTTIFTGVAIWPLTVLLGMVARSVLFDRGTATSFVVVATLFLGVCLVGWRAIERIRVRRGREAEDVRG